MARDPIIYYRVGIAFEMRDGKIKRRSYSFLSQQEADRFIEKCKPFGGVAWVSDHWLVDPEWAYTDLRERGWLQYALRESKLQKENISMIHPEMKEFLDFVESKPPMEGYLFQDGAVCACGQYAASIGIMHGDWMDEMFEEGSFWRTANGLAGTGLSYFGPLAARIRKHITENDTI